jgi:ribokinase
LGRTAQSQALLGQDWVGEVVRQTAAQEGLPTEGLHSLLAATAQSVILYDETGRRMIHTDLKDAQERPFPPDLFIPALAGCDLAVLGNINWSRPFLTIARRLGKPIAADVHTIGDLDDEYNRDFMAAADILFMSDEKLATSPEEWARAIFNRYAAEIVVIGLGGAGLFDGGDSLCVGR